MNKILTAILALIAFSCSGLGDMAKIPASADLYVNLESLETFNSDILMCDTGSDSVNNFAAVQFNITGLEIRDDDIVILALKPLSMQEESYYASDENYDESSERSEESLNASDETTNASDESLNAPDRSLNASDESLNAPDKPLNASTVSNESLDVSSASTESLDMPGAYNESCSAPEDRAPEDLYNNTSYSSDSTPYSDYDTSNSYRESDLYSEYVVDENYDSYDKPGISGLVAIPIASTWSEFSGTNGLLMSLLPSIEMHMTRGFDLGVVGISFDGSGTKAFEVTRSIREARDMGEDRVSFLIGAFSSGEYSAEFQSRETGQGPYLLIIPYPKEDQSEGKSLADQVQIMPVVHSPSPEAGLNQSMPTPFSVRMKQSSVEDDQVQGVAGNSSIIAAIKQKEVQKSLDFMAAKVSDSMPGSDEIQPQDPSDTVTMGL